MESLGHVITREESANSVSGLTDSSGSALSSILKYMELNIAVLVVRATNILTWVFPYFQRLADLPLEER